MLTNQLNNFSKTLVIMSNKFKLCMSALSILVFQLLIAFTFGNGLVINRKIFRDFFRIPSSKCILTNSNGICTPFQAREFEQDCTCYCPDGKNTFVLHNNVWTCLDNSKMRELQGRRIGNNCAVYSSWGNMKLLVSFNIERFHAMLVP